MQRNMGTTNVKTIGGRQYLYYEYMDDGRHVSRSCGRADSPESARKALMIELEELEANRKRICARIAEIREEIG